MEAFKDLSTNDWFKLAYQERILDLFNELEHRRISGSIHTRRWNMFIPPSWKRNLLSYTDEDPSTHLQALSGS